MSSRIQPTSAGRLLCGALIALFTASGCATQRPDPDLENRIERANSHFELGIDHLEHKRYAIGLRELRTAESLDPKNPRIHAGLAQAYLHKGRADEAEAHLLRALEIHPEYHDARLNLSALYLLTARYEEAAEQAQALVDDPTFPAVWRAYANLAVAELSQQKYAEAREHAEMALEFDPTYWPALLTLGSLEHKEGRVLEAITYYERTLEQKPWPGVRAEANYHLAEIYVSLGKRDKAVGHLMTAVAQTPDGEWGKKSEEYLEILR